MIDLFQAYQEQPDYLKSILAKYEPDLAEGNTLQYHILESMLADVQAVGYTFDYGLDGEPFALRPIGIPINQLEGFEDFAE